MDYEFLIPALLVVIFPSTLTHKYCTPKLSHSLLNIYIHSTFTVKQACQIHSGVSPRLRVCVWLCLLPSSIMSNTLPRLSIWYLFGYCLCYYCCCSLIHSLTALISIISHQLIHRNVIIVTRFLMLAVEMRNGSWWGVLQAVTYGGEFSPTLSNSPIEFHTRVFWSICLSIGLYTVNNFSCKGVTEEEETWMKINGAYIWLIIILYLIYLQRYNVAILLLNAKYPLSYG